MRSRSPFREGAVLAAILSLSTAHLLEQPVPAQEPAGSSFATGAGTDSAVSCWRLGANAAYPAGPGQWSRVHAKPCGPTIQKPERTAQPDAQRSIARPAIRRGDQLLVEEDSNTAHGYLRARALADANRGKMMEAQLLAGGALVRVVAISPGHARFVSILGERP